MLFQFLYSVPHVPRALSVRCCRRLRYQSITPAAWSVRHLQNRRAARRWRRSPFLAPQEFRKKTPSPRHSSRQGPPLSSHVCDAAGEVTSGPDRAAASMWLLRNAVAWRTPHQWTSRVEAHIRKVEWRNMDTLNFLRWMRRPIDDF